MPSPREIIEYDECVALTFVLAPLPNALFARCGGDDFSTEYDGSGPVDLGRFITAFVVVTGFALPLVLAHSEVIAPGACAMSIAGGAYVCLIHSTALCSHICTLGSCMVPSWHIAQHSRKRARISNESGIFIKAGERLDHYYATPRRGRCTLSYYYPLVMVSIASRYLVVQTRLPSII